MAKVHALFIRRDKESVVHLYGLYTSKKVVESHSKAMQENGYLTKVTSVEANEGRAWSTPSSGFFYRCKSNDTQKERMMLRGEQLLS